MSGDKNIPRGISICSIFAKHGYVTAFIEYKLATPTSGSWAQALYDCKTAIQFLRKNVDKYNIDTNHIGVMGGSAGAHLAAMVGAVGRKKDWNLRDRIRMFQAKCRLLLLYMEYTI